MKPIRVVFLGTGDAFSAGGRNQAAIYIRHPDVSFLLDCGATTLAALNRHNFTFEPLDYILISHLHGDHIAGLPFLFLHLCYIEPRTRTLEILGPDGVEDRTLQLFKAMYPDAAAEPLPFGLNFTAIHPHEPISVDGLEIEPFPVPHMQNPPSMGFSLELDGRRIVYSGDSGWTDELPKQANGADLFICECSFYESEAAQHLNYPTIAERLTGCGAKKIILTHLGREMLQHKEKPDLQLACDGSAIQL